MRPLFGYHLADHTFPGVAPDDLFEHLVEVAGRAEDAGFDMVTVMDHLYQIDGIGPEDHEMLEAYSTLAAIAARTKRVRLGALVTGVTYRNPALLAKTITTLDVISGGRAICGLGAAWNESEHRGYGFDFPPIGERMDRLDEALTICRLMFTEERPTFEGRHYRIEAALNQPRPIQPGGPRIIVGGGGEQRTLRLVARHADYAHWFPLGMEVLRHKSELLGRYCEEIGRDPATVTRTVANPFLLVASEADAEARLAEVHPERRATLVVATPARAVDVIGQYLAAGFGGFTFTNTILREEAIDLAAEVIHAFD
ncbi:MAG TPA: LLM class F420-dependent oxidoreductase [Candidatus Limnocylindrales bacterium]|jgi:F420-dependent oxidoreductase-like protein|nr:LLM class F420-dependent oxidoreductase [Candidatus Limnocylindrales bacterium]